MNPLDGCQSCLLEPPPHPPHPAEDAGAVHYVTKGQQFVPLNKNVNKTKRRQQQRSEASAARHKHANTLLRVHVRTHGIECMCHGVTQKQLSAGRGVVAPAVILVKLHQQLHQTDINKCFCPLSLSHTHTPTDALSPQLNRHIC